MRERKGTEFINAESIKSGTKEKKAPRARNRTVMLNAEETQSVRSKLKKNLNLEEQDDGFLSPKKLADNSDKKTIANNPTKREEDFLESDVFIADDEEQIEVAPQRRVKERVEQASVDVDEFVVPSDLAEQVQESTKIILEEPEEFDESSELVESVEEEPVSQKVRNVSSKLSVAYANSNSLIGFLILIEEGSDTYSKYIELKKGRLIVTSIAPKGGDYILIKDDTVSPMHAVLRISDKNSIQILDQLSEEGTKIVKASNGEVQELLGDKSTLEHGDVVSFGGCSLKVCLIG